MANSPPSSAWLLVALVPGAAFAQLPDHAPDGAILPLPAGHVVIQGDIVVPPEYFELRGTYVTDLWPAGTIPYQFNANVNATNRQRMLTAMGRWEAAANVTFIPRTTQQDFLFIQANNVNNSYVGRKGGLQIVNITTWTADFVCEHELGHALGFWHEQSRLDRDAFIRVEYDNICDTCCSGAPCDYNFDIRIVNDGGEYGPYDFDSVMHYAACDFSSCGVSCSSTNLSCRTITVLPPNTAWQNQIGQRDHLSQFDVLTMSFLYPQPNWRFVDGDWSGSQLGTFFAPYRTATLGFSSLPTGGTLWIQPGDYLALGSISKPMTIRAPLGGVTLGSGR